MKFTIWYMKPEWFVKGIMGEKPDPKDLEKTHVSLLDLEKDIVDLDQIYKHMQAENWSPHGEARPLIENRGLNHTSMSVGDVIVVNNDDIYVVTDFGFTGLGSRK
jgi:hypothetical protein